MRQTTSSRKQAHLPEHRQRNLAAARDININHKHFPNSGIAHVPKGYKKFSGLDNSDSDGASSREQSRSESSNRAAKKPSAAEQWLAFQDSQTSAERQAHIESEANKFISQMNKSALKQPKAKTKEEEHEKTVKRVLKEEKRMDRLANDRISSSDDSSCGSDSNKALRQGKILKEKLQKFSVFSKYAQQSKIVRDMRQSPPCAASSCSSSSKSRRRSQGSADSGSRRSSWNNKRSKHGGGPASKRLSHDGDAVWDAYVAAQKKGVVVEPEKDIEDNLERAEAKGAQILSRLDAIIDLPLNNIPFETWESLQNAVILSDKKSLLPEGLSAQVKLHHLLKIEDLLFRVNKNYRGVQQKYDREKAEAEKKRYERMLLRQQRKARETAEALEEEQMSDGKKKQKRHNENQDDEDGIDSCRKKLQFVPGGHNYPREQAGGSSSSSSSASREQNNALRSSSATEEMQEVETPFGGLKVVGLRVGDDLDDEDEEPEISLSMDEPGAAVWRNCLLERLPPADVDTDMDHELAVGRNTSNKSLTAGKGQEDEDVEMTPAEDQDVVTKGDGCAPPGAAPGTTTTQEGPPEDSGQNKSEPPQCITRVQALLCVLANCLTRSADEYPGQARLAARCYFAVLSLPQARSYTSTLLRSAMVYQISDNLRERYGRDLQSLHGAVEDFRRFLAGDCFLKPWLTQLHETEVVKGKMKQAASCTSRAVETGTRRIQDFASIAASSPSTEDVQSEEGRGHFSTMKSKQAESAASSASSGASSQRMNKENSIQSNKHKGRLENLSSDWNDNELPQDDEDHDATRAERFSRLFTDVLPKVPQRGAAMQMLWSGAEYAEFFRAKAGVKKDKDGKQTEKANKNSRLRDPEHLRRRYEESNLYVLGPQKFSSMLPLTHAIFHQLRKPFVLCRDAAGPSVLQEMANALAACIDRGLNMEGDDEDDDEQDVTGRNRDEKDPRPSSYTENAQDDEEQSRASFSQQGNDHMEVDLDDDEDSVMSGSTRGGKKAVRGRTKKGTKRNNDARTNADEQDDAFTSLSTHKPRPPHVVFPYYEDEHSGLIDSLYGVLLVLLEKMEKRSVLLCLASCVFQHLAPYLTMTVQKDPVAEVISQTQLAARDAAIDFVCFLVNILRRDLKEAETCSLKIYMDYDEDTDPDPALFPIQDDDAKKKADDGATQDKGGAGVAEEPVTTLARLPSAATFNRPSGSTKQDDQSSPRPRREDDYDIPDHPHFDPGLFPYSASKASAEGLKLATKRIIKQKGQRLDDTGVPLDGSPPLSDDDEDGRDDVDQDFHPDGINAEKDKDKKKQDHKPKEEKAPKRPTTIMHPLLGLLQLLCLECPEKEEYRDSLGEVVIHFLGSIQRRPILDGMVDFLMQLMLQEVATKRYLAGETIAALLEKVTGIVPEVEVERVMNEGAGDAANWEQEKDLDDDSKDDGSSTPRSGTGSSGNGSSKDDDDDLPALSEEDLPPILASPAGPHKSSHADLGVVAIMTQDRLRVKSLLRHRRNLFIKHASSTSVRELQYTAQKRPILPKCFLNDLSKEFDWARLQIGEARAAEVIRGIIDRVQDKVPGVRSKALASLSSTFLCHNAALLCDHVLPKEEDEDAQKAKERTQKTLSRNASAAGCIAPVSSQDFSDQAQNRSQDLDDVEMMSNDNEGDHKKDQQEDDLSVGAKRRKLEQDGSQDGVGNKVLVGVEETTTSTAPHVGPPPELELQYLRVAGELFNSCLTDEKPIVRKAALMFFDTIFPKVLELYGKAAVLSENPDDNEMRDLVLQLEGSRGKVKIDADKQFLVATRPLPSAEEEEEINKGGPEQDKKKKQKENKEKPKPPAKKVKSVPPAGKTMFSTMLPDPDRKITKKTVWTRQRLYLFDVPSTSSTGDVSSKAKDFAVDPGPVSDCRDMVVSPAGHETLARDHSGLLLGGGVGVHVQMNRSGQQQEHGNMKSSLFEEGVSDEDQDVMDDRVMEHLAPTALFRIEQIKALTADDSVMVRKAAMQTLSMMLRQCPQSGVIRRAWKTAVLPCVADPEASVAESALQEVRMTLLRKIAKVGTRPDDEIYDLLAEFTDQDVEYMQRAAGNLLRSEQQQGEKLAQACCAILVRYNKLSLSVPLPILDLYEEITSRAILQSANTMNASSTGRNSRRQAMYEKLRAGDLMSVDMEKLYNDFLRQYEKDEKKELEREKRREKREKQKEKRQLLLAGKQMLLPCSDEEEVSPLAAGEEADADDDFAAPGQKRGIKPGKTLKANDNEQRQLAFEAAPAGGDRDDNYDKEKKKEFKPAVIKVDVDLLFVLWNHLVKSEAEYASAMLSHVNSRMQSHNGSPRGGSSRLLKSGSLPERPSLPLFDKSKEPPGGQQEEGHTILSSFNSSSQQIGSSASTGGAGVAPIKVPELVIGSSRVNMNNTSSAAGAGGAPGAAGLTQHDSSPCFSLDESSIVASPAEAGLLSVEPEGLLRRKGSSSDGYFPRGGSWTGLRTQRDARVLQRMVRILGNCEPLLSVKQKRFLVRGFRDHILAQSERFEIPLLRDVMQCIVKFDLRIVRAVKLRREKQAARRAKAQRELAGDFEGDMQNDDAGDPDENDPTEKRKNRGPPKQGSRSEKMVASGAAGNPKNRSSIKAKMKKAAARPKAQATRLPGNKKATATNKSGTTRKSASMTKSATTAPKAGKGNSGATHNIKQTTSSSVQNKEDASAAEEEDEVVDVQSSKGTVGRRRGSFSNSRGDHSKDAESGSPSSDEDRPFRFDFKPLRAMCVRSMFLLYFSNPKAAAKAKSKGMVLEKLLAQQAYEPTGLDDDEPMELDYISDPAVLHMRQKRHLFLLGEIALWDFDAVWTPSMVETLRDLCEFDHEQRDLALKQKKPHVKLETDFQESIRAHALVAMGKLCLREENLAKTNLKMFAACLKRNDEVLCVRSNAMVILCDLAQCYATIVDRFLPVMTDFLGTETPLLRMNAVMMVSSLLAEDFLKLHQNKMLPYRLIFMLADPDRRIREFVESVFLRILHPRNENVFLLHFREVICGLNQFNEIPAIATHSQAHYRFDVRKRFRIYYFLLKYMDGSQKLLLVMGIVQQILNAWWVGPAGADGPLKIPANLGSTGAGNPATGVLFDCFQLLRSKELRSVYSYRQQLTEWKEAGDDQKMQPRPRNNVPNLVAAGGGNNKKSRQKAERINNQVAAEQALLEEQQFSDEAQLLLFNSTAQALLRMLQDQWVPILKGLWARMRQVRSSLQKQVQECLVDMLYEYIDEPDWERRWRGKNEGLVVEIKRDIEAEKKKRDPKNPIKWKPPSLADIVGDHVYDTEEGRAAQVSTTASNNTHSNYDPIRRPRPGMSDAMHFCQLLYPDGTADLFQSLGLAGKFGKTPMEQVRNLEIKLGLKVDWDKFAMNVSGRKNLKTMKSQRTADRSNSAGRASSGALGGAQIVVNGKGKGKNGGKDSTGLLNNNFAPRGPGWSSSYSNQHGPASRAAGSKTVPALLAIAEEGAADHDQHGELQLQEDGQKCFPFSVGQNENQRSDPRHQNKTTKRFNKPGVMKNMMLRENSAPLGTGGAPPAASTTGGTTSWAAGAASGKILSEKHPTRTLLAIEGGPGTSSTIDVENRNSVLNQKPRPRDHPKPGCSENRNGPSPSSQPSRGPLGIRKQDVRTIFARPAMKLSRVSPLSAENLSKLPRNKENHWQTQIELRKPETGRDPHLPTLLQHRDENVELQAATAPAVDAPPPAKRVVAGRPYINSVEEQTETSNELSSRPAPPPGQSKTSSLSGTRSAHAENVSTTAEGGAKETASKRAPSLTRDS
ncbi:unnamed protein product [Amoebophrya sp. A120]|nr:unnamed protein product [Amoebophrya sp. A120]|eukprot:GSA120T00001429001.1